MMKNNRALKISRLLKTASFLCMFFVGATMAFDGPPGEHTDPSGGGKRIFVGATMAFDGPPGGQTGNDSGSTGK